ncbi:ATP-dependent helicase (plasmid) [Robbsia andropogonis]|uniref:ATP-dependent helicase n=1 Tax=Robbsia andropogonis TaxID=28092 RepID=UPI003D1CECD9
MLDSLNARQREVVELRRNSVAIACPGAGKTTTIATKAAMLLQESNARVGAVTFSKDAATELRERIRKLAGRDAKERLLAGTFHSLAYKQISRPGRRLDIASEGDRQGILMRVLTDLGLEWKLEDAITLIEQLKTNFGRTDEGSMSEKLYQAYQEALERNGKIDFQDMLRLSVERMESGDIEPYAFTYLLVDEFQDTDPLQYRWVELHAKAGAIVTVVGDDDQSIYGFRAALGYRGMEDFAATFNATRVVLGSNYRCRSEILTAADRLIRHNAERIPKELVAHKGPGGTLLSCRFSDEYEEGEGAVAHLGPLLADGQSCAILTRTNRHLDALEGACRAQGVKYYRAAGKSILKKPEGALYCNLLLLIEGQKKTGLDTLLAHAQLGLDDLRLLRGESTTRLSAKKVLIEKGVSEVGATAFRALAKRLHEWSDLTKRQFYSLVLEGAKEWLVSHSKTDNAVRSIDTIHAILTRLNGSFSERIEFLKRENNAPAEDAVLLTTMHSSKGLEWDNVWICRAEETVVPADKSPESEERRLFYVAMTRARQCLMVSSTQKNIASRFVQEAGLDAAIE